MLLDLDRGAVRRKQVGTKRVLEVLTFVDNSLGMHVQVYVMSRRFSV